MFNFPKPKKKILPILAVLLLGAGVLMLILLDTSGEGAKEQEKWGSSQKLKRWLLEETVATTTPEHIKEISKSLFSKEYTNKAHGFSFKYPEGFNVGEFNSYEEDKNVVLLQHPERQLGVQITITSLDEPINLNVQYIREELPSYRVEDPQPVRIDGENRGVVFIGRDESFGTSREIWFTYGKTLYQITSYKSLDPFVKTFFKTWSFK